ncbi:hypothetical protein M569_14791 [Genlisea aurea]|uniref:Uncharacterized protein n=1 Tax=Genlisea aurea TaxID=192259 RepID=S8DBC2_9LAMI|nr:hypothetical protein M569_14791 [Genlisea aurea]
MRILQCSGCLACTGLLYTRSVSLFADDKQLLHAMRLVLNGHYVESRCGSIVS